jgi:hypothetical protein
MAEGIRVTETAKSKVPGRGTFGLERPAHLAFCILSLRLQRLDRLLLSLAKDEANKESGKASI